MKLMAMEQFDKRTKYIYMIVIEQNTTFSIVSFDISMCYMKNIAIWQILLYGNYCHLKD